jgi:hypothetical protein
MNSHMFGHVGISSYDSSEGPEVKVEYVPAALLIDGTDMKTSPYYRVSFYGGQGAVYLLLSKVQLEDAVEELEFQVGEVLIESEKRAVR